jgi:organic hydroperoxide reductase OsmC/OhrA
MHPFPHHYVVTATARPSGDVPLAAEGLRIIESAMPKEFDGPGNQWSPESLLAAAVADAEFWRGANLSLRLSLGRDALPLLL